LNRALTNAQLAPVDCLLIGFSGDGPHMGMMSVATGFALLCAAASPVFAADMPVKAARQVRVATAEPVCLRWVQQNYSWYNYCDPVPYYPRATRYWWGF
jgi:hypothetical protein